MALDITAVIRTLRVKHMPAKKPAELRILEMDLLPEVELASVIERATLRPPEVVELGALMIVPSG